ncbi:MAG TPA: GIY-YIG nuclease family protein [Chitinophagaceae bacterium]|nr:GIY-YIG nuclease family protein [Chitinophagaceae bacterium]
MQSSQNKSSLNHFRFLLTFAALDGKLVLLSGTIREVAQPGSASRLWREGRSPEAMKCFVYVLFSGSLNKYYCGCTEDVEKRITEHNSGKGNFTSKGIPWRLIKKLELASRPEAMQLERKIKKRGIKRFLQDLEQSSGSGAAR